MQTASHIAFKEWAVVVEALGRGQQAIILRKGGILENAGEFQVDHDRFWLFPTLYHQQMDSVLPEASKNLDDLKAHVQPDGAIRIEFFTKIEQVSMCRDFARVQRLRGQHVWKDSVIEERFGWGKSNGIHLILARVYRSPQPQILPLLPHYGGCKSWVELERSLPTSGISPVLSDAEFSVKAKAVLDVLGSSG